MVMSENTGQPCQPPGCQARAERLPATVRVPTSYGDVLPALAMFGFTEVRTTAGITAGIIEVAAFATLAVVALAPAAQHQRSGPAAAGNALLARLAAGVPRAGWAVAVASVAVLVVLGVSAAQAGGPPPAAVGSLKTAKIAGVTVLTNAGGFTLTGLPLTPPARRTATDRASPTGRR
jgi:hypothetical protein